MECRVNARFYNSFCFKRNWTDRVQVGPQNHPNLLLISMLGFFYDFSLFY